MGVSEQIIFPEIQYDQVDQLRGMDITITTTARDNSTGPRAARRLQLPVPQVSRNSQVYGQDQHGRAREAARRVAKKYAAKRAQLKEMIRSPKSTPEQRAAAQVQLQTQPRDASLRRQRNRCAITGRSRGVYRKFGLARTKIREVAMRGEIPGLGKASW